MHDERAKALSARLSTVVETFAAERGLARPPEWVHWYVVTVRWDGTAELEPTYIIPRTAPEGFEAYARDALMRSKL